MNNINVARLHRQGSMSSFSAKISNLPKYLTAKDLCDLVSKITGLESGKFSCRKNLNWDFGFVNFKSADVFDLVMEKHKKSLWKSREIIIEPSEALKGEPKRKQKQDDVDTSLSNEERLNNQVTPLWKLAYEKQLEFKEKSIKKVMRKYWDDAKSWYLGS